MYRYFIIYKPYLVLSQFTSGDEKKTLADFFDVPKNVYPVGRLDHDSEGLLILTNDPTLNHQLLDPRYKHEREYLVQVEGEVTKERLNQLSIGVNISIDGKLYRTEKADAKLLSNDINVPERNPPIRFRKAIPTSWISLTLTEGKNRQVRKMTAKVGHPTLRLIRQRIANVYLAQMQPGELKEFTKNELFQKLFRQH
jgi:23S rRNA pseudouridine2457 synthase